jgi:hypothetical protein
MDKLKIRFTKPPGAINSLSAQQVVVDKFEDWESIPDPMPATKMVPEWFKQTKPLGGPIDTMPTIKIFVLLLILNVFQNRKFLKQVKDQFL